MFRSFATIILLVFLTFFNFRTFNYYQSRYPVLSSHDQARDILIASHISQFGLAPQAPPFCGGCKIFTHLKNSDYYYYFLSIFYRFWGLDGVLFMCAVWTALLIPLVYLLTFELSHRNLTSLFASLLAATSPLFTLKFPAAMPYQPLFIPTISCLFILILLKNDRFHQMSLSIISGIVLIIGLQFHLSFILLIPIYLYHTFKVFQKNAGFSSRRYLLLANLLFFLVIVKNNFSFNSPIYTPAPNYSDVSHLIVNLISYTQKDLTLLIVLNITLIPSMIILGLLLFRHRPTLIKILPFLVMYPLVGIYPFYNFYTAAYWPVFISLLAISISLFLENYFIFFVLSTAVFYFSKNPFPALTSPLQRPSIANLQHLDNVSDKINRHLTPTQNTIFQYDGYLNIFTGYYYYREIKNHLSEIQSNEQYLDYSRVLGSKSINKIIFCNTRCRNFEQEYSSYTPIVLEKNDFFTLYQLK